MVSRGKQCQLILNLFELACPERFQGKMHQRSPRIQPQVLIACMRTDYVVEGNVLMIPSNLHMIPAHVACHYMEALASVVMNNHSILIENLQGCGVSIPIEGRF